MRAAGFLLPFALATLLVKGEVGLFGMDQFDPLLPSTFFSKLPKKFGARKTISRLISF